jgi:hypothetical protein
LTKKEEEVSILKQNSKIHKYTLLDTEYKQLNEDYNRLKDQYGVLNQKFNE